MKIAITVGDPAGIGPEICLKMLEYATRHQFYQNHHYWVAADLPVFSLTCNDSQQRLMDISKKLCLKFC